MADHSGSESSAALTCAQFLQLFTAADQQRPPLLIDIRAERQFRRGHLAGSHPLPAPRLLSGEPPEGDLVLISEVPEEALVVIEALHADGYGRRIRYLEEGLHGWRARGLPIEASAEPSQAGAGALLLPALLGTGLILAAAALTSLPLLALGTLLLWEPWLEPLQERRGRRRLTG